MTQIDGVEKRGCFAAQEHQHADGRHVHHDLGAAARMADAGTPQHPAEVGGRQAEDDDRRADEAQLGVGQQPVPER
jgi:hypothetical protein